MTRITLKPVDDGQKSVEIPVGKTTIGRGPFLGCGDKKVSRNHAVLEVTDQGEVYITPTHVNPCFLQSDGDGGGTVMKKDEPYKLVNGDSFSLLPRAFRYVLIVDDDVTDSDVGKSKETVDVTPEDKVNGMMDDKVDTNAPDAKVPDIQPNKEKVNGARACQQKKESTSIPEESPIVEEQEKNSAAVDEKKLELNGNDSLEPVKPILEKETEIQKDVSMGNDTGVDKDNDAELKVSKEEVGSEDSNSRNRRTLPDWLVESSAPEKEEKKRTKTTKQHHREKASAKRKTESNISEEKKRKRTERRKESDMDERVEHQRQSCGRSSRTNRQTRQGLSLEDFIASDDDEWQSDNSEPRHKKRRRNKRKDDDSGSDWEVEHKKSRKVSHKYSSGSESGSDWGTSSQKKKKAPKTRRRRSKRVSECDVISEDEDDKSLSGKQEKRLPCQYGKKCYRKNPAHLDQFSHPGDSDYESPVEERSENASESEESNELPECPYGTSCFRKNQQHKKEYKHTKKVRPQREAAKQAGKKTTVSRENDEPDNYDLNDSFINDDSDEYKPADSGSDFDSSQETSSPAKGSKRPTKNKRAKRV